MKNKIILKNATILTLNTNKDILKNHDILIENDIIKEINANINSKDAYIIDCTQKTILPGFIQTHTHLCQTLFRGLAENLELLDWLRNKIWPFEAAHTSDSMYFSAMLGISELISSGTTTILDMGSTKHTDAIFEAAKVSGIRFIGSKALMDQAQGAPDNFLEKPDEIIEECETLYQKLHNQENERLKFALAPRFILSCSNELFLKTVEMSNKYDLLIHTHACENKKEGEEVEQITGMREFEYFEKIGALSPNFLVAHCIHLSEQDKDLIQKNGVKVLHCPSSNFKLGSGMLNIFDLLKRSISVSIGADGTPCNNNLNMLQEIRTTALMQNVLNAANVSNAYRYLELATIEGAKALGIDKEVGSLETGKKADLIIMNLNKINNFTLSDDIAAQIVFSSTSNEIESTMVDGKFLMKNQKLTTIDEKNVMENCMQFKSLFNAI